MSHPTLRRRSLRGAVTALLAGTFVVGAAGTAEALVADRPTDTFPDFNGSIEVIVHRSSTIYVGGDFTSVNDGSGSVTRNHAAAIDATTGRVLSWNPNVSGVEVRALSVNGDGVYIGGEFSAVDGRSRTNIALVTRGSGRAVRGFAPRPNGPVNAFTFSKGSAYFGGEFTKVDNRVRSHLAAVSRTSSARLRSWSPSAGGGQVFDLVRRGKGIYVGGAFDTLNGSSAHRFLARVSARTGGVTRAFQPKSRTLVHDVHVTRTRVYAALGGKGGGGALSVRRSDGARVFFRRFDGDVEAITIMKKQVYVGGHFDNVCATSAQSPANGRCLDPGAIQRHKGASMSAGGRITGWNPSFNSALGVAALDRYATRDKLLTGGAFTRSGSVPVDHFAVFN